MKFVASIVCLLFLFQHTSAQSSVFVFGKCPNVCTEDVPGIFLECAGLKQLGCIMKPCTSGGFSCALEEDAVPEDVTVQPGGQLEFSTLRVDTPFSIFIDFKATPLPLDMYLLADNTGSMGNAIPTVKTEFSKLIDFFRNDELFESPHFGVGAFGDELDSGFDNGFKNILSITPNTASAQEAVDKYVAIGGRDRDEANLVALYKVATDPSIKWRSRSRKIVVYFGDVPGHEPTCGPFGTLTRDRVIKALKAKGITVVGISLNNSSFNAAPQKAFGCPKATPGGPKQAEEIIDATSGVLRKGTDKSLIEDIKSAIKDLPSTFSVDTSDCSGKLRSTYNPKLPLSLLPGDMERVKQTVSVPMEFCSDTGGSPQFTCVIRYNESGVFLPPTEIVAKNIVGCPDL